jgi:endonuclease/exonuclease/phosphatase family metal-dependent hydrolase
MRIMYWNCTAPGGTSSNKFSDDKCKLIGEMAREVNPDILVLDEVSATVFDNATATAFATSYINTANYSVVFGVSSVNPGVHLNCIVFTKPLQVKLGAQVGIPSDNWNTDGTIRDLSRIQFSEPQTARTINLWCLHANASTKGGKTAASLIAGGLKDSYSVYMGDLNCSPEDGEAALAISAPKAKVVRPALGAYTFSQWRADDFTGTVNIPGAVGKKVIPNAKGFIDYAMAAPAMTVTAVNCLNGASDDTLRRIMSYGDHFPIAYDVKST